MFCILSMQNTKSCQSCLVILFLTRFSSNCRKLLPLFIVLYNFFDIYCIYNFFGINSIQLYRDICIKYLCTFVIALILTFRAFSKIL